MLSLPLITPQTDIIHGRLNHRPRSPSPPNSRQNQQHAQHQHRQQSQTRRDEEKKAAQSRTTPLALLTADEAAIAARKAAIRNFGAYWIRPPGVSKTLQAMTEEAAELAEQEELLRQEQGLRDLEAQQQLDEARQRAAEAGEGGMEGEEQERDLDDDIPDADADEGEDDGEDLDDTFNEDSVVEGSRFVEQEEGQRYAQMEEAELTGAARDEEDLGIEHERNLDDSVPEAGSYQHTDTEMEDSTSDEDSSILQDSFAGQAQRPMTSSARRPNTRSSNRSRHSGTQMSSQTRVPFATADNTMSIEGSLQERMRAAVSDQGLARSPGSLNLSSSLLESSFVGSSPVMQRGARGRQGGNGRGRLS